MIAIERVPLRDPASVLAAPSRSCEAGPPIVAPAASAEARAPSKPHIIQGVLVGVACLIAIAGAMLR